MRDVKVDLGHPMDDVLNVRVGEHGTGAVEETIDCCLFLALATEQKSCSSPAAKFYNFVRGKKASKGAFRRRPTALQRMTNRKSGSRSNWQHPNLYKPKEMAFWGSQKLTERERKDSTRPGCVSLTGCNVGSSRNERSKFSNRQPRLDDRVGPKALSL